jgi:polyisoprenoid-binding protein YceI
MRVNRPFSFAQWLARTLLILVLLSGLTLAACFGSRGNSEPATPTNTPQPAATEAPPPTEAPVDTADEATSESDPEADSEANTEAIAEESAAEASAEEASDPITFLIDPEQSEARFIVDEMLFGSPNTVVGVTNEISGQIEIDLNNPPQSTVGVIQVNARSLATDNRFRNRSVNRLILQSNRDEYQFITFTPTTIEGIPDEVSVGDTFSFQIVGDLKIRDIVQPTTFDITVTADSESQISGLAQTVVLRSDFELTIPNVDGVADVTEEVRLELEFIAIASE